MRCYEHLNILSKDESLKKNAKKKKKKNERKENGTFFEKKIIEIDDNK